MQEVRSNDDPFRFTEKQRDAVLIPIIGAVDSDDLAIMDSGLALYAKNTVPNIQSFIGRFIRKYGNHAFYLGAHPVQTRPCIMLCAPYKANMFEDPNLDIIETAMAEVVTLANIHRLQNVYMPPIGSEDDTTFWTTDVKRRLITMLDDRFTIVLPEPRQM